MIRRGKKRGRLAAGLLAAALCLTGCAGLTKTPGASVPQTPEKPQKVRNEPPAPYESGGAQYYFKSGERYLSVYNGKEFEDIFIKGVNIGLGKPGYFPGETAVTKEEYARWLQQIGEMNSNCIRVYTVQPPNFYEAFYEYNLYAEKPLYLLHGTWYNEERMVETSDVYDEALQEELYQDMRDLVDIIHGNCVIEKQTGKASGTYTWDISPYVMGWLLGIESDADLVEGTNDLHPDITSYEGQYICAENLQPFEVFWAQTSDYVLSYEMENYGMQRPLSYSNWPTADMLEHPSETMAAEMSVTLNVENLKPTDAFVCGLYASYHVYPYYPNFLYTQLEYKNYKDEDGKTNTYRPYLEELIAQHHMPVVVAEFGVPASRGATHTNPYTGFDQGHHTEEEQGEILVSMMDDIHDAGYAGGLIFAWQDEWFKRTWNTMSYTNPNRRAYWCDVMTCEQHFGLLDFVPGARAETVLLDGETTEWTDGNIRLRGEDMTLSVKYDCAYLYLMVEKKNADYDTQKLVLPIDVTPKSGSMRYGDYRFDRPADFVLTIDGKENSTLEVQSYYDRYLNEYGELDKEISVTPELIQPDSDHFSSVYYFMERELILPDRRETVPMRKFDAGALRYGTNDAASEHYDSLADFYYQGDVLEIRIPWLMLNFRDPSTGEIEDDFWANGGFSGINIDSIWVGVSDESGRAVNMVEYTLQRWDHVPYFERLRKSYYSVQEQFSTMDVLPG